MSARESILAALQALLAPLVAAGCIDRSRREQLPGLPAIVLRPGREVANEQLMGVTDRRLSVQVEVYASGPVPDAAADAVLAGAWAALAANRSLGVGIDAIVEGDHEIGWEFAATDQVRATLTVYVNYRTAFGAM